MIEILMDYEKYLFYAKDIIYVNAYKNIDDDDYFIDIILKNDEQINLDFNSSYTNYIRVYDKILKIMSEVE